MTIRQKFTSV